MWTIALNSEAVVKHIALSTFCARGGGTTQRKNKTLSMIQHCISGGRVSDVQAAPRLQRDVRAAGATLPLQGTLKDGAKCYSYPQSCPKAGVLNSRAKMSHCHCHGNAGHDAPAWGPSLPVTLSIAGARYPVLLKEE